MQLTFSETISRLHGPIHTAESSHENKSLQFKITPDLFCRNWFDVSCKIGDQTITLGKYVNCINEAKKICEIKFQEIKNIKTI